MELLSDMEATETLLIVAEIPILINLLFNISSRLASKS